MSRALQAIVFDFDGVIANSEPLHLKAFQQALAPEGIELDPAEYYARYLGYDDVGMFEALAKDRRIAMSGGHVTALVVRKGERMQEMLRSGTVRFPGATEFIREAAAAVPIAIASGAMRHEIEEVIDAAGVSDLFATIVAAGDTPQSKPSPAPYRLALERLRETSGRDIDPRRAVAIEDSKWGLESAQGAGLRLVGVTNSYPAHELTGAELVVDSLTALTLPAMDRLCETGGDACVAPTRRVKKDLVSALVAATDAPGTGLADATLIIARIEYPRLDPEPYLAKLDSMGEAARRAIVEDGTATGDASTSAGIRALNSYLFETLHFVGNRDKYEDPRNSCLNEVLDRRTGIPITLSVVYMEVARRASLQVDGINFPGHFLVRCPETQNSPFLIIDPFHAGALLSEHKCRLLLQKHVGSDVAFSKSLLAPATRLQIIARMLLNLKRIYVHMRSFPQARDVTELLLAITPSALSELRDRGLLAYHLNDVTGALRDLQAYLRLTSMSELDKDARDEHQQIWEHVKTLRRRVAALN